MLLGQGINLPPKCSTHWSEESFYSELRIGLKGSVFTWNNSFSVMAELEAPADLTRHSRQPRKR